MATREPRYSPARRSKAVTYFPKFVMWPLAAQSVRSRLEGRVPEAAIPVVDSLVRQAAEEDLPTEPLVQKALEGGAKHVSPERIVAAVQVGLTQVRDARILL